MKPSRFEYVLPRSIEEAVAARVEHADTVVLSGGQSLVPTLNFRLSNPEAVIDLRLVPGLDDVRVEGEWIHVGGRTRQRDLELDDAVHAANPLIRETLHHVAHPVIRNRGTVGGSIAHADPSAELPCLLLCLDGEVVAHGPSGARTIDAQDLFEFILSTTLEPDEILTEVRFPVLPERTGWCFTEFARRHGDFALAGVAATLTLADDGTIAWGQLAACGVTTTPVRLVAVEDALLDDAADPSRFREIAALAADVVTVPDDESCSSAYRRDLLVGLVERALRTSWQRATERATARTSREVTS
ncbi:xanthine dehydrogenase family protein subunit M [Pimelobacter simplex]|uniref:Carbon monoxide dehydrogenase medium chain n=1 Tax=Nocardioides simplex TaxID=2045 RepID=A0A0A1DPW3_NOCSI|nr:xanthine dehydrogenase family protein subunit M [Pimelobacter simplex]AIY19451.1 Carbon monoxide dehydrogenase medium chain [Pimelobacter simplex]MCG8149626.1 xanthine dehydrogenase family protein subunit M [Pimelobacter simplex]GEB16010.1 carbon monoxide dehydrogenase [Pimelobacter simplex]SFM82269.1 carbon-monoxide dehydrogenase medium subunit [Pimelobacter simplex]